MEKSLNHLEKAIVSIPHKHPVMPKSVKPGEHVMMQCMATGGPVKDHAHFEVHSMFKMRPKKKGKANPMEYLKRKQSEQVAAGTY